MPASRLERTSTRVWTLVCAAWLIVVWVWPPGYLTLTTDDSFYVFLTAAHVSAGQGPTFDGINPTNGFHPLWMLALVPFVPLGNGSMEHFAKIALTLDVGLVFAAVLVLARGSTMGASLLWVAATLMLSFYSAKAVINGLESALQFFLVAVTLVLVRSARSEPPSRIHEVAIGALCGLATLARLDAVFFGLTLCAMPVLWPELHARSASLGERLGRAAIAFGAMGIVLVPYFAYNLVAFHHLMPVSGAIKAGAVHLTSPAVRVGVPLLSLITLGVVIARGRGGEGQTAEFIRFVFPLVSYVLLETAYNGLVRGIVVPEIWYLAPHLLLAMLVFGYLLDRAQSRPLLRPALAVALFGFLVVMSLTWVVRMDPRSYSSYFAQRRAGEWIERNTPADALLAGWDCGIAAAHSGRRFMNLDGLISSWDYKENYLDRDRVGDFITRAHPVDYVCQYVTLGRFDGQHIGGVDFTTGEWRVVYQERVPFRSILTPWRTRIDVQLILTRRPEGTPFTQVAERLVRDGRTGS